MGWFSNEAPARNEQRPPPPVRVHEQTLTEMVHGFQQRFRNEDRLKKAESEQETAEIDTELLELVQRINAGGPVYFMRKDGTVTNEPWSVRVVVPEVTTDDQGRSETRFNIVLFPRSSPDALEVYELGDFFKNRWIPPNEKEKLARKYIRGELPSYEEFERLIDAFGLDEHQPSTQK